MSNMYENPAKFADDYRELHAYMSESSVDSGILRREKRISGAHTLHQRNAQWAERSAKRRAELTSEVCDVTSVIPYGGILSSGINLASTTIGSGILSMPAAFHSSGMVMGIFYLLGFGGLAIFSYTLLGLAAMRTGCRNYGEIVYELMGPHVAFFCGISLLADSLSALLAYVSSIMIMFEMFFTDANENFWYFQTLSGQRFLTFVLWFMLMLPLGMPRAINSLKFPSLFAIVLMALFVAFVVANSVKSGLSAEKLSHIVYFQSGNSSVSGLMTFIFAYGSQSNCYNIFQEVYEPSVRRLTLSATLSVIIAFSMYLLVGVFGYLEFGPAAGGHGLSLYNPAHDSLMTVGYVFIAFKLCVSYGLYVISFRSALYYMLGIDLNTLHVKKHIVLMALCCTLSLIIPLFLPDLSMLLDLIGGSLGGFNAYIFPALLAMYTGDWTKRGVGPHCYYGGFIVLLVGVVAFVFSTVSGVHDMLIEWGV